ncbi:MAG: nucleotidyltransferase domain-containing protein [Sulfolobales archaeon]
MRNSALLNKLRDIAERIIRSVDNVVCIVVFGSFVTEYFSGASDIDVAVVLRDFKDIDSSHEILDDRILEIIYIGEERFFGMIQDSHPFILNVVFNGIPLYGDEWLSKVKSQITKPDTDKWIKKYLDEGIERLREARDIGDINSALTLILNAYLLSRGIYELSYSIDKLIKKVNEEDIINTIERVFMEQDTEKAKILVENLVKRLKFFHESVQ